MQGLHPSHHGPTSPEQLAGGGQFEADVHGAQLDGPKHCIRMDDDPGRHGVDDSHGIGHSWLLVQTIERGLVIQPRSILRRSPLATRRCNALSTGSRPPGSRKSAFFQMGPGLALSRLARILWVREESSLSEICMRISDILPANPTSDLRGQSSTLRGPTAPIL